MSLSTLGPDLGGQSSRINLRHRFKHQNRARISLDLFVGVRRIDDFGEPLLQISLCRKTQSVTQLQRGDTEELGLPPPCIRWTLLFKFSRCGVKVTQCFGEEGHRLFTRLGTFLRILHFIHHGLDLLPERIRTTSRWLCFSKDKAR